VSTIRMAARSEGVCIVDLHARLLQYSVHPEDRQSSIDWPYTVTTAQYSLSTIKLGRFARHGHVLASSCWLVDAPSAVPSATWCTAEHL